LGGIQINNFLEELIQTCNMPLLNEIFEVLIQYLVEFNGEYLLSELKSMKYLFKEAFLSDV
jgi:hypothetical protein